MSKINFAQTVHAQFGVQNSDNKYVYLQYTNVHITKDRRLLRKNLRFVQTSYTTISLLTLKTR